jgi:hypothetical protein
MFAFDLAFIRRFQASFQGTIVFPKPGEDFLAPEFVAKRLANKLSRDLVNPHGCWEWQGTKNKDGYGTLTYKGRTDKAHRIAYRISIGAIPEGLQVLHHCSNPSCINPKHLSLGTVKDKVHNSLRKGRASKPPMRFGKTSKIRGVSFSRKDMRWRAQIWHKNRQMHIGTFKTEQEAIEALNDVKKSISLNGELLISFEKYRAKPKPKQPKPKRAPFVSNAGWTTRLRRGPKYAALTAIDSLSKIRFTGDDVYEAVQRLFPSTPVTRAQISSLLWKLSSSDEAKYRVNSFYKVMVSKGGRTRSEYRKFATEASG